MIVIPAVDLRAGKCVQLVGGSYENESLRLDNPADVARGWIQQGFQRLHLVDLDAATGRGSNADLVREIVRDVGASFQVGGGVRESDDIERLLREGADRVVVGTRALTDGWWLEEMAGNFPGQLIVAADVRGRAIVTHGWSRTGGRDVLSYIDELNDLPLAAVLVTAVHLEGQMQGTDLFLMEDVVESSAHPVIASGGIASTLDLQNLAERGVSAAVVGMALYTGALDARAVAEEFSS
ncbi:MAG TPA: 1-(5-phosphoribosyl)-5-[(5-phosphoribosylamino)methylideneamino] imidazole-4-carboxamide isomerase [Gemmatimonadaceae bacterium]|jgi:phosphoribosylformimino-5-aminoimidazole carboxamide ribotide isomerase|nr:1-(5-phosphoribosyl)-5-[(5-phosphoribosylamino)methylideneamino] imidazole-4-carboxamide isomerase [Gemmatimonadaceae bacterium]